DESVRVLLHQVGQILVPHLGQLGGGRRRANRFNGRVRDCENLDVIPELVHSPKARVQVIQHGNTGVPLELAEGRFDRNLRRSIQDRLREDVGENVDLFQRLISLLGFSRNSTPLVVSASSELYQR